VGYLLSAFSKLTVDLHAAVPYVDLGDVEEVLAVYTLLSNLETELLVEKERIIADPSKSDTDLAIFYAQWGIRAGDGSGIQSGGNAPLPTILSALVTGVDDQFIGRSVGRAFAKAKFFGKELANMQSHHAGSSLVMLFTQDQLGLDSLHAATYRRKHELDFIPKRPVGIAVKVGAGALMMALNVFFVLMCVAYAGQKSKVWQEMWLLVVVLKVLYDIIVRGFMVSLVMGFTVPNLVATDVHAVCADLTESGVRLLRSQRPFPTLHRFSASDFLHASSMVAAMYPDLVESKIILTHSNKCPEPVVQARAQRESSAKLGGGGIVHAIRLSLVSVALHFGGLSPDVQRAVVHTLPSALLVLSMQLFTYLGNIATLLLAGCIMTAIVLAPTLYLRAVKYFQAGRIAVATRGMNVTGSGMGKHVPPSKNVRELKLELQLKAEAYLTRDFSEDDVSDVKSIEDDNSPDEDIDASALSDLPSIASMSADAEDDAKAKEAGANKMELRAAKMKLSAARAELSVKMSREQSAAQKRLLLRLVKKKTDNTSINACAGVSASVNTAAAAAAAVVAHDDVNAQIDLLAVRRKGSAAHADMSLAKATAQQRAQTRLKMRLKLGRREVSTLMDSSASEASGDDLIDDVEGVVRNCNAPVCATSDRTFRRSLHNARKAVLIPALLDSDCDSEGDGNDDDNECIDVEIPGSIIVHSQNRLGTTAIDAPSRGTASFTPDAMTRKVTRRVSLAHNRHIESEMRIRTATIMENAIRLMAKKDPVTVDSVASHWLSKIKAVKSFREKESARFAYATLSATDPSESDRDSDSDLAPEELPEQSVLDHDGAQPKRLILPAAAPVAASPIVKGKAGGSASTDDFAITSISVKKGRGKLKSGVTFKPAVVKEVITKKKKMEKKKKKKKKKFKVKSRKRRKESEKSDSAKGAAAVNDRVPISFA
jgi:hypothetical protein